MLSLYAPLIVLALNSMMGRSCIDTTVSYDLSHDSEDLLQNATESAATRARYLKAAFRGKVPNVPAEKKRLTFGFHEQELSHLNPLPEQAKPDDFFQRQAADEATAAAERAVASCGPALFADLDGVDIAEEALPELGAGSASRPVGKVLRL